ncbi:FAD-dependent oxidoreductase [Catalinimonas sp. 4WD22]|uniref:FAD-dependent oxidoreductase n=1 Tax=Catalinimonas locisalis TaxID=3133978 RepID=UPI003101B414
MKALHVTARLLFKYFTLLVFLLFPYMVVSQEIVWLEAEQLDNIGGWTNDWQFIDQMGSPYLLAAGLGTPVDDAVSTFKTSKSGSFRIWVRSHDWSPEAHPGKFELHINNKQTAKTFGESGKEGWVWEDGGVVSLKNVNELRLKDLTGYYGRCDVIVFSSDLDWTPPVEQNDIAKLRERYGAVSLETKDVGHYDVVVVGGGISGTLAAVAAAREGARTVLIQNRKMLGGNASLEILVPPVGVVQTKLEEEHKKYDVRETGLIEEIAAYGNQRYFTDGKLYPSRLLRLVESEPNLDLFLNTHATGVEMESETNIASVLCIGLPEGQRLRFSGKLFIDCTGNGIIGVKAGAAYMYGRESQDMYNETKAPEEADTTTLPSSLKYWYEPQASPQPFKSPSWVYSFPQCSDFGKGRHPKIGPIDSQWVIELGGTEKTYANAEAVRDDLFKLIYGIWDHLKNHCTEWKEEAMDKKLVWVGHVVGMRESYRLKGDYVMSERDVTDQPLLKDRVAYGGWGLDDHPSLGFFDQERLNNHTHRGVLHSIPYRSLYSKNINNLMMAGRDISVTHVALTATRVMLTCGVIGQATGTAAGMAIKENTSPRGIYQSHLDLLQQKLLKQGAYLIELPNQDPEDLALMASAKASSELTPASEVTNGYARARLPSAFPHAEFHFNAWIPDSTQKGPHWLELNWATPQSFNVVHVVFQNRGELAPKKFRLEKKREGNWETLRIVENSQAYRRFVLPVGKVNTSSLRVVLEEEKPSGGICEIRVYNEPQHKVNMAARAYKTMSQPDDQVLLPWEKE